MALLHAGRLRERVLVQVSVEVQDQESGGVSQTWTDLGIEPMHFRPLVAREPVVDGVPAAFSQAHFTRRFRHDRVLSPKTHRLVFGGRNWDIKGAQDVKPRQEVLVIAEARAE